MTKSQMMSAKVVLLFLFVLISWWLFSSLDADFKPKPASILPEVPTSISSKTPIKPGAPAIADRAVDSLLMQQGSYECIFQHGPISSFQNHDAVYLSGGNMRAEFRTSSSAKTKTHLYVYDGRFLHNWYEGADAGKKVAITSLDQFPTAIPRELLSGHMNGDTYDSGDWHCRTWQEDISALTPPTAVKFTF